MSLAAAFKLWLKRPDAVREAMAHSKDMTDQLCETLTQLDHSLEQYQHRPRVVYGRRNNDETLPKRA